MPAAKRHGNSLVLALAGILIAIFAAAPQAAAQGGEPSFFAIRGARVVPVSGPAIDDATVVVSNGIIVAVGKDAAIPAEAWIIDGKGLTVYPGLIDALTDVTLLSSSTPGRPSSSGPEDRPGATPWRSAADEATLADKRIESWREAGFTTVIASPKDGIFPGQAAVLNLAGDRAGEMVVKGEVAVPLSLNPVGNFRSFPGSLMGVLGYVHQVFLDSAWYETASAAYAKNPRGRARPPYDRTEAALDEALEDHGLVLLPANDSVQIRRALDLADRWKLRAALYGAQMAYETAAEIAAKKLPVLVNLQWPEKSKDADPDEPPTLRLLRFRDRAPSSPAALAKAGVKFAFYSGAITAPKDILKAAKKAVDAGLSEDAALRALTLSPAEIFGVSDRLGSLEPGKIANLLVADGSLFTEKTKIKFVFVDGRKFEIRESPKPADPPKNGPPGEKPAEEIALHMAGGAQ